MIEVPKKSSFSTDWISKGIESEMVDYAKWFGYYLCDVQANDRAGWDALTTSQIRNFFGEVKRIQAKGFKEEKTAFLLIRPKLAYAEARVKANSKGKPRIIDFREIVEKAHGAVETKTDKAEQQFQNFVDFLEAVLAYHKFYGGKD